MSNRAYYFLFVPIIIICGSCAGTRNLQAQSAVTQADVNVCSSMLGAHKLQWTFQNDASVLDLKQGKGQAKLPKKFQVFAVDSMVLKAYLTAANTPNTKSQIVLPISEGVGCQAFEVMPSGTLSDELADKYPQLVSLKGLSVTQNNADTRIDFDGTKMEAQINWNNRIFYITSWPGLSGEMYYIVYKKEDSRATKIPRKTWK